MGAQVDGSIWYYAPNKVLPIVFGVIFLASGVIHAYQTHIYKSWRFTILLPWACAVFVAGFFVREAGAFHFDNLNLFIASTVLLFCAPPIYAGANYFILSRLLYYCPFASPMHPGRIASTFIGLDVLVEILTGNGASRVANSGATDADRKAGGALIKASLLMQAILQIAFVIVTVQFHRNIRRDKISNVKTKSVLIMLYVSTALIFARSVFRVTENFEIVITPGQSPRGELVTKEAYFWIFEVSFLTVNTVLVNVLHPGRFLPRSNKTYLSIDGVTELEGPGWEDKRPFIVTVIDPCDIYGLIRGRDKETAFWEREEHNMSAGRQAAP